MLESEMPLEELLAKYRCVSDTEHLFCLTHICSSGPGCGFVMWKGMVEGMKGDGIRMSFGGCLSESEQSPVIVRVFF
jgi:hypothetical protein